MKIHAIQIPKACNSLLVEIARQVCLEEGIDFDSLDFRQARSLVYFWCPTCSVTYPLTDLVIAKRRKICIHCAQSIKLYATSNKYGKMRRSVFFRYLSAAFSY